MEHCIPVSGADNTRQHLRSTNRHLLAVPRFRLNTYGRRAFSAAGPMACNSLPDFIRDPTSSTDCFRRPLKTYFSRVTSASSALGVLNDYALYKSTHSLTPTAPAICPWLRLGPGGRGPRANVRQIRSGQSGVRCRCGAYVHRHQTAAAAAASHIQTANVNKQPFKTNRRHYAINRPRPWETGCIRRVLTSHRRTTVPGPPCQCPRW